VAGCPCAGSRRVLFERRTSRVRHFRTSAARTNDPRAGLVRSDDTKTKSPRRRETGLPGPPRASSKGRLLLEPFAVTEEWTGLGRRGPRCRRRKGRTVNFNVATTLYVGTLSASLGAAAYAVPAAQPIRSTASAVHIAALTPLSPAHALGRPNQSGTVCAPNSRSTVRVLRYDVAEVRQR
jgi:hypothetical protein